MKFFVDTAEVKDIRELADLGLLDGVTTNPSLIAKAGRPFKEVIAEICAIVDGPVSAEVVPGWAAKLHVQGTGIPYGIAIAASGLLMYPQTAFYLSLQG